MRFQKIKPWFLCWELVEIRGNNGYYVNTKTKARKCKQLGPGYSAIDTIWLNTGRWSNEPKLPNGQTGECSTNP
ncbi:MAG: hypothetical protein KDH96_05700 [Candidatus Riesia sp.]|nr:hypothetical protein [Candidatus Riesia sp.]